MDFKSLPELLAYLKDEKTCAKLYEKMRWNGKPVCPHCNSPKPYVTNRGYKCSNSECGKKFTVRVGTIFENSKIPFKSWFIAIYLITTRKGGVNSVQLAVDLGVTQKTAWFMLQRIRELLKKQAPEMLNETSVVEIDETHLGGKERNRHYKKKRNKEHPDLANDGTPYNFKKVIIGAVERNGRVILKHVPNTKAESLVPFVHQVIPHGSRIVTDENVSYSNLKYYYNHSYVNHSAKMYAIRDSYTNTIEAFWSVLKRGIYGVYHTISEKHLERYLNEFACRFNSRNNKKSDIFIKILSDSEGRLLYRDLIAKKITTFEYGKEGAQEKSNQKESG